MSREAFSLPPVLAYADPVSETWGVAALGGHPQMCAGPLAGASAASPVTALGSEVGSDVWTLTTDAGSLRAHPQAADVSAPDADPGLSLVRLAGPLPGAPGPEPEPGGVRHLGRDAVKADSIRLLCAWFPPERGMALSAVRPPRAKGQDRDELSVICAGEPDDLTAFDVRLSSTYGDGGRLRRLGVEMWLGENEEADMYSLRMAGEASGAATVLEVGGARIQAQPIRCHSRGETGAGVYLLISGS